MKLVKYEGRLQLVGFSSNYATYQKVIFYLAKYAVDPLFYFVRNWDMPKLTNYHIFSWKKTMSNKINYFNF
jgi:hypothetical protein